MRLFHHDPPPEMMTGEDVQVEGRSDAENRTCVCDDECKCSSEDKSDKEEKCLKT